MHKVPCNQYFNASGVPHADGSVCSECGWHAHQHGVQDTVAEALENLDRVATANSRQVGGAHYKTGGEEHWDRVYRLNLDYFQGQITKYIERWRLKNGVEDLKKARHFLDKYIELNGG